MSPRHIPRKTPAWAALVALALGGVGGVGCNDGARTSSPTGDADPDAVGADTIDTEEGVDNPTVPEWSPANAPGPYRIGVTSATFRAGPDRELPGVVWYPTHATQGERAIYQELLPRPGVWRDAPPADGVFPIVLFSHGSQSFSEQSFTLTEFLASHGFVVAACDHIGNTTGTNDKDRLVWIAWQRPHDISAVLDHLLAWNSDATHPLQGRLDTARVAVMGHSFGGFTALAVAGAGFQASAAKAICNAEPADQRPVFCNLMGPGLNDDSLDWSQPLGDARVKAAIAFAAAGFPLFGAEGIGRIAIPTLIATGDHDLTVPAEQESLPIHAALQAPKALFVLKKAGHFTFSDMCRIAPMFGDGCGKEYITADVAQPLIARYTLAFLRRALWTETRDAAWFTPTALASETAVEWQEQGLPAAP